MKLGLLAALTGIAVVIGVSKSKRHRALPAPAPALPPKPPVTGTAPQEGTQPSN
jgi:hypothetical protein